jgi:chemotaxis protein MotB
MARNPWDDDPDILAMRGSMRPRGATSWGRILFGVLIVACGTFGLAYYLPLFRAHAALVKDHSRLRSEVETARSSLKQAQSDLKTANEKREELEAERDKRESEKKALGAGSEATKSSLLASLDKPAKKKQALVGVDEGGVRVALASSFLFSTGKIDVSDSGKDALCNIAKASAQGTLRVTSIAADGDIPAALKTKYENAWEYTGAASASVANTLENKCSVARARLTIESAPGAPASPAFAGQSLPAPRVEILLAGKKP